MKTRLALANSSARGLDRDITFEPDNVTLAFSDRTRIFACLDKRLGATSLTRAQDAFGLIHFLAPNHEALHFVAKGDNQAKSLILASTGSGSVASDAAKAGKLHTSGRMSDPWRVCKGIANLRCFFLALAGCDMDQSLAIQKLLECTAILTDRHGRVFFGVHRHQPSITVHLFQDPQLVLTSFVLVANNIDLCKVVMAGSQVAMANCATSIAVSDGLVQELRTLVNGDSLGKFEGLPCCCSWFSSKSPKDSASSRGSNSPDKRQKTDTRTVVDAGEKERLKGRGSLPFDVTTAGSTELPNCPVHHKDHGAKSPERLCMRFMT